MRKKHAEGQGDHCQSIECERVKRKTNKTARKRRFQEQQQFLVILVTSFLRNTQTILGEVKI